MRYILALCLVFPFAFSAQPEQWQAEMAAALTEELGVEIAFRESGPQTIFYADTLPEGSEDFVLEMLSAYAGNETQNGFIAVVGLRPEIAYRANAKTEPARVTNTTIVAEYAALVDGRVRDLGNVAGQSFTGCISSTGPDGASVRCSDGGSSNFETRCQWYGDEVVCRSTD